MQLVQILSKFTINFHGELDYSMILKNLEFSCKSVLSKINGKLSSSLMVEVKVHHGLTNTFMC